MLTQKELNKIKQSIKPDKNSELVLLFNMLSDKGRFLILKLLMEKKELCVTELANVMESSISATSHQLRILETGGLIEKERDGQKICYKIKEDYNFIKKLQKILQ